MATEITLPELGENVEGGMVVEIMVSAGDQIQQRQTLLEVEAGKSTVEVPATVAGKVIEVLVHRGEEVKTGQVLMKIEAGAATPPAKEKPTTPKTDGAARKSEPPRTADRVAPPAVERPQPRIEARSTSERPTAMPVARQTTTPELRSAARTKDAEQLTPLSEERPSRLVPASPATRRLARELGVDIARVKGTARHGRVTPEDVKTYVRQIAASPAPGRAAPRLPDFSKWGPVDSQPLSTIRQETAKQMALAWATIPHVTQHDLADTTDLDAFRRAQPKDGPRITVTAFALKAVAIALREFPAFNASLDLAQNRLIYKQYYHVGVAVDTERGLLVPVIRDVDRKSVYELATELNDTAERARQRKITGDDLSGGTFTITNLGGIGGTGFTPIINFPEVAILGLSRARLEPVVHQGSVVPRLMLPLSLSYDHRVIDGADAARFTRRVAEMLENPLVMLLHA